MFCAPAYKQVKQPNSGAGGGKLEVKENQPLTSRWRLFSSFWAQFLSGHTWSSLATAGSFPLPSAWCAEPGRWAGSRPGRLSWWSPPRSTAAGPPWSATGVGSHRVGEGTWPQQAEGSLDFNSLSSRRASAAAAACCCSSGVREPSEERSASTPDKKTPASRSPTRTDVTHAHTHTKV